MRVRNFSLLAALIAAMIACGGSPRESSSPTTNDSPPASVAPPSPPSPPSQPPPSAPAQGASLLGINLGVVSDWDPAQPFADAMKNSRRFGSVNAPYDEAAQVDAQGWPTGDAGVVVMVGVPNMGGIYKLSFKGTATVSTVQASDGTTRVANAIHSAGITTADIVVGPAEQNLFLSFTGQPGGVKDVRLLRPNHDPSEIFNAPFLSRLEKFGSIRFMDFTLTNGNPQVEWSDRPLPSDASQQGSGAAWEYVVALANRAGKDIWINVPHGASDTYVTKLAQLLKYGSDGVEPYTSEQANPLYPPLGPALKVYVEWSNELWNGGFSQSRWLDARADEVVAARDPVLLWDGDFNRYIAKFRMVGKRSREISQLFRSVFGDSEMMTRVRPVLPAQLANTGTLSGALDFLVHYGGAAKDIYAVTGAAYITVYDDDAGNRAGLTVDSIFSELAGYTETNAHAQIKSFAKLAKDNGVKLVAYEGGQHLYGAGSSDAKLAAQSDPRMKDALLLNYANWFAAGGDLFVYYNLCSGWNKYGSWGLSSDITSEVGPKWDAIHELAK